MCTDNPPTHPLTHTEQRHSNIPHHCTRCRTRHRVLQRRHPPPPRRRSLSFLPPAILLHLSPRHTSRPAPHSLGLHPTLPARVLPVHPHCVPTFSSIPRSSPARRRPASVGTRDGTRSLNRGRAIGWPRSALLLRGPTRTLAGKSTVSSRRCARPDAATPAPRDRLAVRCVRHHPTPTACAPSLWPADGRATSWWILACGGTAILPFPLMPSAYIVSRLDLPRLGKREREAPHSNNNNIICRALASAPSQGLAPRG